jgi:formimidoylglutamate deiminase
MTVIRAARALLPEGWARDVAVTLGPDGRIARVETGVAGAPPVALLPALSNLHAHSFQRAMAGLTEARGPDPRDSFWSWRDLMYRFAARLTPEQVEAVAEWAFVEMLEAGFAAVAEFHYLHHAPGGDPYAEPAELSARVMAAAARAGIGLTHLPTLYTHGGAGRAPLSPGQARFGCDPDRFARLLEGARAAARALPPDARVGAAAHSLRAVDPEGLAALVAMAPEGPLHIHAAEQPKEVADVQAQLGARPVDWLLDHAPLDARWCVIHATHMTEAETARLARSGAVAGLCPITEANLGDGLFPAPAFLAAGGRFGVGSDSNVRIDAAEELRTLDYGQRLRDCARCALAERGSTGRALYDAALAGGAQALGRDAGALAPGLWADLMALDLRDVALDGLEGDAMLDAWVFAGAPRPVAVWSAGRAVVAEGRHPRREAAAAAFLAARRALLAG